MPTKPEFKNIKDLYDSVKGKWGALGKQDEQMQRLFDMTYDVPHPEPTGIENFEPTVIRSGWTKRAIKSFVAMFAEKPVAHHKPGIGAALKRLSEKIEGFLNTLPWAIEAKYGTFWCPAVENCGVFGRGWVEVLPKRKRWVGDPDYPRKGKGNDPETGEPIPANESTAAFKKRREVWKKEALPPISIRNIPADSVYAIVTEGFRVLKAVRYVEISLAEAATRWPEQFEEAYNTEGNDPTDAVAVFEYVDEEWCAHAAEYKDIQTLFPTTDMNDSRYRHYMRMCPWVLVEALTTAFTDPNKRWEPYLLEAKDVGVNIDSLLTKKAMATQIHPLPQPVIEIPDKASDPEKAYETITLSPPDALILYGGAKMHIESFPDLSPEAESLLDRLERAKDRSLPNVGAEIAEGGSQAPAWNWRLRGDLQERDMAVVVDNLSLSAKRIFQAILHAIQSRWINETVYIGKETKEGTKTERLSPKDIVGQINRIDATVKTSTIMDRNQDLGAMKMAVEEPLKLGRRWAGEKIGRIENIEEVLEEALLEEMEFSDQCKSLLLTAMLEEADLLQRQEAAVPGSQIAGEMGMIPPSAQQAVQRMLGGGAPGGGGMPPMQGLGTTGVPQGAHPTTMAQTGVPGTGGPKPTSPIPGGAAVIPGV